MVNEAKFSTLEEEGPDALEVAAQAHEEREAQTCWPNELRIDHLFKHSKSSI